MNKYTEHFLSRQVFASLWGICFLAALRRSTPIRLPFDNQYKRFMADHEQEFSQLLDMLQEITGLSSESISTGKQDAPWLYLTESSADYDEISLNITLSLKAGKISADDRSILQFDYSQPKVIHRVAESCLQVQYDLLFSLLLQCHFCFVVLPEMENNEPLLFPEHCIRLLQILQYFVYGIPADDNGIHVGDSHALDLLQAIFQTWKKVEYPIILGTKDRPIASTDYTTREQHQTISQTVDPRYRAWLLSQVPAFEAYLSQRWTPHQGEMM